MIIYGKQCKNNTLEINEIQPPSNQRRGKRIHGEVQRESFANWMKNLHNLSIFTAKVDKAHKCIAILKISAHSANTKKLVQSINMVD